MKVAVLSESPADEAAVRILIEGLLATETEVVPLPTPKTRGWKAVLDSVRGALYHLSYQTDADALVMTLDSNGSPVHQAAHETAQAGDPVCRLCRLRNMVDRIHRHLQLPKGRDPLKIALGLAVPAVEAWYLVGLDPRVSEAAWNEGLQSGNPPYSKLNLKQQAYDTEKPSLALEQE